MPHILFPGRHHLLTHFQHQYLTRVIKEGLNMEPDVNGTPLNMEGPVTSVIFAVTSANHSNTRRNPLPLHYRSMAIQDFSKSLGCPCLVYDIDDVGDRQDFAEYTLKRIYSKSGQKLKLNPDNTVVLCSTPSVIALYENLGFRILPAELKDRTNLIFNEELPWDAVSDLAKSLDWRNSPVFNTKVHESSKRLWLTYDVGDLVKMLFNDDLIGDDGDLTETRDYNTYVRGMDEIASIKFNETRHFVRPGRIGDIGCAVGSWIKLVSELSSFAESDFYGIEISRQLFDICEQRKNNREFKNPFVFFQKRNAVTGLAFEKNSMNTLHTSSLTHEIKSYVGETLVQKTLERFPEWPRSQAHEQAGLEQLRYFIRFRHEELTPGGVWINRDVVGSENGEQPVLMKLCRRDGDESPSPISENMKPEDINTALMKLSTNQRFRQFSKDFRNREGGEVLFEEVKFNNEIYIKLSLRLACEFMTKKDYTDNWHSEMHETFCFWSFQDWERELKNVGFQIYPGSAAYRNEWIVQNRWKDKVALFDLSFQPLEYPVTHMVMVAMKEH